MDLSLLTRALKVLPAAFSAVVAAGFTGCFFNDPLQELDPYAFLQTLPPSEGFPVARRHVLESFGHYGCSNCPEAEGKLRPYFHASSGVPYNPRLVVVTYHVAFPSSTVDPWITTGTQARNDIFGFTSLPQVKLNGSNGRYGIREKDVRYFQGEYDSLLARLRIEDTLTRLDLRIDTTHYDSASQRLTVRFTLLNRATSDRGGLSCRMLAVKNKSVVIPLLPNHPWETIVTETTDKDSAGLPMALSGMPGLRAKTWVATMTLASESTRNPAPSNPENPSNYAVVVFVQDNAGVVQNVSTRLYAPE